MQAPLWQQPRKGVMNRVLAGIPTGTVARFRRVWGSRGAVMDADTVASPTLHNS